MRNVTRVNLERTSSGGELDGGGLKSGESERSRELKDIRLEWEGRPPRKLWPLLRFGRRRFAPHSSEPRQSSMVLSSGLSLLAPI